MTEGVMNCKQLARRGMDIFAPMYEQWRKQDHCETSLMEAVSGLSAARVLEKDLRNLGLYLIGQDDHATRIELGALVDCIAELRSRGIEEYVAPNAEQLAEEFQMEKHKNAGGGFVPPAMGVSLPLSLRVANDLQRLGGAADSKALKEMLVEFLHRIVLQDGNVHAQEIAAVNDVEEFLDSMIAHNAA